MPVKFRHVISVCLVFVVLGVGIFVGKQVSAAGNDPGSQGDPLVAKSYVDTKIAAILDRLTKLENDVAQLQKNAAPTAPTQTPSQPPASASKTGVVKGWYVNVRTGPGTNYSVVTTVNKGASGTVLDSQKGWYKLKFANGTSGWIAGWLLSVQ